MRCRQCGCTEDRACTRVKLLEVVEACSWAEPGLCSACAPGAEGDWLHPDDQLESALSDPGGSGASPP